MEPNAQPSLADVKTAIEESNRLWQNEYKTVQSQIKDLADKGKAIDPILIEHRKKLDEAMDTFAKQNELLMATQAAVNKLKLAGVTSANDDIEKRVEKFNHSIRTLAREFGRATPEPLDAAQYRAYVEAEDRYLRVGETRLTDVEKRALSVGTATEGGYLVTPDLSGRLVQRIFETSPMRQYSRTQVISTDALEGMADLDEATVGWVSELGTRSDSATPQVPAPYRIPVHEIYSMPKISQKLLEDANIDVGAWLSRKVGDKIGRTANTAFVTGNGVGKPRGFASYTTAATADTSRAWGIFEHTAAGGATLGTDPNGLNKLLTLIHTMKDVYAANSAWYCNRTVLGTLRQLTDASSAGKYVFVPSFTAGLPDTFMGYPVRKLQDMADIASNALAVAFGDMDETYLIVDRLGITVLVDPYTAKPYVVWYTRARVGGDVVNFESLKFLKMA